MALSRSRAAQEGGQPRHGGESGCGTTGGLIAIQRQWAPAFAVSRRGGTEGWNVIQALIAIASQAGIQNARFLFMGCVSLEFCAGRSPGGAGVRGVVEVLRRAGVAGRNRLLIIPL